MAVHDDYLACESYLGKELDASNPNITKFYDEKTQKYYFALLNDINSVALKSEGYTTTKSRDNGLSSVLKNMTNPKRFQIVKNKKVFNLVLKAGNNQEIAVSCDFATEADAQASIAKITNTEVAASPKKAAASTKAAAPKAEVAPAKTSKATAKPAEAKKVAEAKTVEAKKVATKTEAPTKAVAPKKAKASETVVISSTEIINLSDYLATHEYLEKERIWDSYGITGFVKFRHSNGKYYFGVYNPDGTLYLKSKGYEDEAGRDSAFDLMESSILLEENYKVEQIDGNYYAILFEYNEDLAISREFISFIDAHLTTPGGRPKENVVGTMY